MMSKLSSYDRYTLLLAAAAVLLVAGPVTAQEAEGPTVLTNDHLELTREGLASEGVVDAGAAPAQPIDSIPVLTADPAPVEEAPAPAPMETAEAEPEPAQEEVWRDEDETEPEVVEETKRQTVLTYELCMERSIRTGNGYSESDRVCRAVLSPPSAS